MPSCDRRRWIGRICPILVGAFALAAYPACSDGDPTMRACPPECEDAPDAGTGGADAGGVVPPPIDADGGPAASMDGGMTEFDTEASRSDAACFNGADDDEDDLADCADSSCGVAPYCCVGETAASCCAGAGQSLTLLFSTCGATTPAECGPATAFGSSPSTLEEGAFVPNGGAGSDSGLVLGGPIDATRERILLEASLIGPADGCEGDCIDAILLGLTGPVSGGAVVQPDIAVMVRGSRGDVALVIAGEVVAQWSLPTSTARRYQLELSPDGEVILRVNGDELASASYLPRPDRRAAIWGRNHNRTGDRPPSSATDVTVRTWACDVPSALRRDAAPVAPWDDATWSGLSASSPSIARSPSGTLLALELPDGIGLLEPDATGWTVLGDLRAPPLAPPVNERYQDPELVVEADRYVLYLTHQHADGRRTVARAEGEAGFVPSFGAPTDVALPVDGLESPAVIDFTSPLDGTRRRLMAATLVDGDGTHVALLEATDASGAVFDWASTSRVVEPGPDFAFDDDEVGEPDLVVDRLGLLRLYYAGRRGTRWAIGMRVSGDGVHWRTPDAGAPIFGGSGAGFDALGARDPSVWIDGAERALFYTGTDGARLAVGRAVGGAP